LVENRDRTWKKEEMLTKFETKSKRVKGLSFHPNRPWILASLHTGAIQLWDYRVRVLIDKFEEHDGPVRGICFHLSQPLFVSGGDDYKIKVWNYKQRRCLFTLLGHLDYIRTVQFHHESPWILSASDDQTIRIWNWQSRSCISILTGHNHYVMCAQFHPTENLVVSASLDQTVRVWDISGLRVKNYRPQSSEDATSMPQNDLFGNTDAVVLHVLEGHDRGVNWAAFHPEDSLIVSGADDRHVKFWRMSDTRAYEVDTLKGHINNVSCVLFHPRKPLILSNSEDMTIRVWDLSRRLSLKIFRRDHEKDRFWTMTAHPEQNLFAAGHDRGLIVFKLEHERPAYCVDGDILYYVKDKLYAYDFKQAKSTALLNIRKKNGLDTSPRFLHYNAAERAILIMTNQNHDLYVLPKSGNQTGEATPAGGSSDKKSNNLACFVARNRFAVLDVASQKILIKNLEQKTTKEIALPKDDNGSALNFDRIWPATTGSVLLRDGARAVWLYDLQRKKAVSKVTANNVKFVSWSSFDKEGLVALMGRDSIVLATRDLKLLCSIHDIDRIKSGAWHPSGVFIYSTLTHLKYLIPNGDSGIIRTLNTPLFVYACAAGKVFSLDRKCRTRTVTIDPTEFLLKQAISQKDYPKILGLVQKFGLLGQSIIAYLQKKGYPELALHFVKDEKTRFNLAIECGNLFAAVAAAKVVDEPACWQKLGTEALRQGNHQVVEMAYQRTKNFEKLSFLYLITGNIEKLQLMLNIAEKRGDVLGQYHNALFLGDFEACAAVLHKAGQTGLAYATAATYGLESAGKYKEILEKNNTNLPNLYPDAKLLAPPVPISSLIENNWPLLTVQKSLLQQMIGDETKKSSTAMEQDDTTEDQPGWGDPDLDIGGVGSGDDEPKIADEDLGEPDIGEGEGWDIGLEGLEDIKAPISKSSGTGFFVAPRPGKSYSEIWVQNSNLAVDHIAAGNIETAMQLLNSQVGIINFAPLKSHFLNIYSGATMGLPTLPLLPVLLQGIERDAGFPLLTTSLGNVIDILKAGYKATTAGKFTEAVGLFQQILNSLLFVVVTSRDEETEALELLGLAREYLTGLKIETKRKELAAQGDKTRMCELAAYFTHTNLQPMHLMLSLSSAMSCSYKIQNYKDASSFAKRLLELNPKPPIALQAKKVIAFAEKNNTNAEKLNYDERNPFVLCGSSFTPIYKGSESVTCPYCKAHFLPQFKGKLCNICLLAKVGADASGLTLHQRKTSARR